MFIHSIATALVASLLAQSVIPASAAEPVPIRVIGKGVLNRETEETLQLACVGALVPGTAYERECSTIRFYLWRPDGAQVLIGPKFALNPDSPIRKQLKEQFKAKGLKRKRSATVGNGGGFFFAFMGAMMATQPGALIPAAVFVVLSGFFFGWKDTFAIAKTGSLVSDDIRDLQSRAVVAWQIKPEPMRAKKFRRAVDLLVRYGQTPVAEAFASASAPTADAVFLPTGIAENDVASADVLDLSDEAATGPVAE